jgi:hypothetical protein
MADTSMTDGWGERSRSMTYGHIVSGHPEIRRHRDLLRKDVENPIAIHFSDADPDCRLYFGEGPRAAIMLVVVAQLRGGFVKTAHLVKATKGAREWSQPTP